VVRPILTLKLLSSDLCGPQPVADVLTKRQVRGLRDRKKKLRLGY
jgi:hypothetical protein